MTGGGGGGGGGGQLAISMSNTGGAWDNAKKYTEKGELNGWFEVHTHTHPSTTHQRNFCRYYPPHPPTDPRTESRARAALTAGRAAQYHDGNGVRDEAEFKRKAALNSGDAALTQVRACARRRRRAWSATRLQVSDCARQA